MARTDDSLRKTIRRIRKKIRCYENKLSDNEAMTRHALIDPLLVELGWDVSDPGIVEPEKAVSGGSAHPDQDQLGRDKHSANLRHTNSRDRVDYFLANFMVLEAKRLGAPIDSPELIEKTCKAAMDLNVRYAGLTDGRIWSVYRVSPSSKPVEGKSPELHFRLTESNADCMQKMRCMSWEAVEEHCGRIPNSYE